MDEIILFLAAVFFLSLLFLWRQSSSQQSKVHGVVKELWVYPIKSCRGIQLSKAEFSLNGFAYDRLFMITDQSHRFISQRTHPKLALLEPSFQRFGHLTLTNPVTQTSVEIPLEEPATPYEVHDVTVWGDTCEGIDMGDQVAKFINEFLGTGQEMRLMRMPDAFERKTDRRYSVGNGRTGFADGFPFLILSEASLDTLLSHTRTPSTASSDNPNPSSAKPALSLVNFRPNIVVTQCVAFAEDSWKEIEVCDPTGVRTSTVPLSIVKPCARCKIPNLNPYTGEFPSQRQPSQGEEPGKGEEDEGGGYYVTRALQAYRTGELLQFFPKGEEKGATNRWGKSVFFGQNAEPRVERGVIEVGDVIRVSQQRQQ